MTGSLATLPLKNHKYGLFLNYFWTPNKEQTFLCFFSCLADVVDFFRPLSVSLSHTH